MSEWALSPGDKIKRTELHDTFGGSRQGGISPSARSPNLFIFSDRTSGEQHDIDDWKDDGLFHYTGEGQHGDQRMAGGNLAVLNAYRDGRALRVFQGTGGDVEYQGRFELDADQPWYEADAPETGGGPVRKVIVFRLRPTETQPGQPRGLPSPQARVRVATVPVEVHNTEMFVIDPSRKPYEAERRESKLVQLFKKFLEAQGHTVERLMITPAGEAKPIFTDLYIRDAGLLIEAKGSTDRMAIRMAIGQLLDYKRFVGPHVRCAVLLASEPRKDLADLLAYASVGVYCPSGSTFRLLPQSTQPDG
jgi:hypothetical protein